jgi:very-short-patch-repair endonuclease
VDFYAPTVKLVIEVDGSQHLEENHIIKDQQRDMFLENQGLKILRFNSSETLTNTASVCTVILEVVKERKLVFAKL